MFVCLQRVEEDLVGSTALLCSIAPDDNRNADNSANLTSEVHLRSGIEVHLVSDEVNLEDLLS